jgi:thiamine pyrophosphate-dependent acetolactate synthase large subunit-like protein
MQAYKGGPVPPERLVGMDLDAPPVDIPSVARGFGVPGRLITEPADLRDALAEPGPGPRLLDVLVQ